MNFALGILHVNERSGNISYVILIRVTLLTSEFIIKLINFIRKIKIQPTNLIVMVKKNNNRKLESKKKRILGVISIILIIIIIEFLVKPSNNLGIERINLPIPETQRTHQTASERREIETFAEEDTPPQGKWDPPLHSTINENREKFVHVEPSMKSLSIDEASNSKVIQRKNISVFLKNTHGKFTETELEAFREQISDKRDEQLKIDPDSVKIVAVNLQDGLIRVITANEATAKWVEENIIADRCTHSRDLNSLISEDNVRRTRFTRCKIRIRSRKNKKLNEEGFFEHLRNSNNEMPLEGAEVTNIIEVEGGYKIIFCKVKDETIKWLLERDGFVFFDIERTRFIWDGLKEVLDTRKKEKFSGI